MLIFELNLVVALILQLDVATTTKIKKRKNLQAGFGAANLNWLYFFLFSDNLFSCITCGNIAYFIYPRLNI